MVGFCVDTIKLFLSWEEIADDFDFKYFAQRINSKVNNQGRYKGWSKGAYKGLRVTYHPEHGIYLLGSISNFAVGKFKLLNYIELRDGIEMLSKELILDLHKAQLRRIDLALNIVTDKSVEVYSNTLFLNLSRFKRFEQDKGVRFESKQIQIAIYDKQKELKEKLHFDIKENLLRIEFRVSERVSKFFGIKKMIISDLYVVANYLKLLDRFRTYFLNIKFSKSLGTIEEDENITPKSLGKCLQGIGAQCLVQNDEDPFEIIERWDKQGKFKNPKNKARCKALLNETLASSDIDKVHPLIGEIISKVKKSFEKEEKELKERRI